MSGIAKRTLYYERDSEGCMKFHDFCTVITGIGVMVELAQPLNLRKSPGTPFANFTPVDEINRVDELKDLALGTNYTGEQVHGGTPSPRVGR